MPNQLVLKYLHQTQELFGDTLYLHSKSNNINFYESGNINSNIIFIKNIFSNNEEQLIFNKILKALKLSQNQFFIIDIINSNMKSDKKLKSLLNQLNSKFIITLGLEVSHFLLDTNKSLDILRTQKNYFKTSKVISTYSIQDIMINSNLKKHMWNDLKIIL
tara:strand:+ start:596 stop:1078 length:483 start_codon:yes stop_codon:yes gene_type:complete